MANNSRQPESSSNEFCSNFYVSCAACSQKSIRACGKESIDPMAAFAR
jgi:hypothetical protein